MREMSDPIKRYQALSLFRMGLKPKEVAEALGVSVNILKKEEALDPAWYDEVQAAMGAAFEPVLRKALELTKYADPEGDNAGAHAAMALVFKHYNRALDRSAAKDVVILKAQAQMEVDSRRPASLPITNPDQIDALIDAISHRKEVVELPATTEDEDK